MISKNPRQQEEYRNVFKAYLLSPKSPSPGIIYAFSLRPLSIHPVTTRSDGYLEQNVLSPSGEDICKYEMLLSNRCLSRFRLLTKLMNMIRSSGTPCSKSTSTAFMADPPVAEYPATENFSQRSSKSVKNTHLASGQATIHISMRYLQETARPRFS